MTKPQHELFGLTWVGWLNVLLLQWLFVRLSYITDTDRPEWVGWKVLRFILPLTGWWSPYIRVGKK